jgi:hypothetical protein
MLEVAQTTKSHGNQNIVFRKQDMLPVIGKDYIQKRMLQANKFGIQNTRTK